ncbi:MAG: hypothetical protein VW709_20610, partial [Rickettsiales bacterium]
MRQDLAADEGDDFGATLFQRALEDDKPKFGELWSGRQRRQSSDKAPIAFAAPAPRFAAHPTLRRR